jgi:hypothetical protein
VTRRPAIYCWRVVCRAGDRRGSGVGDLLFLTVTGIVGAASAGSLFTAAFFLLVEPKTAMGHPRREPPIAPSAWSRRQRNT